MTPPRPIEDKAGEVDTALVLRLRTDEDAKARLFRLVHADAGCTMRELERQSGVGHTRLYRLLDRLLEEQRMLAVRDGKAQRLFPFHPAVQSQWRQLVVLRDRRVMQLYQWLLEQQECSRSEVLDHALAAWGWPQRSTIRRLAILSQNHLAVTVMDEHNRRQVVLRAQPMGMEPGMPLLGPRLALPDGLESPGEAAFRMDAPLAIP